MKIKKKEFVRQLNDNYWKGVEFGMKFALEHPTTAKFLCFDCGESMRKFGESLSEATQRFVKKFEEAVKTQK